jgi:hypothetical protein
VERGRTLRIAEPGASASPRYRRRRGAGFGRRYRRTLTQFAGTSRRRRPAWGWPRSWRAGLRLTPILRVLRIVGRAATRLVSGRAEGRLSGHAGEEVLISAGVPAQSARKIGERQGQQQPCLVERCGELAPAAQVGQDDDGSGVRCQQPQSAVTGRLGPAVSAAVTATTGRRPVSRPTSAVAFPAQIKESPVARQTSRSTARPMNTPRSVPQSLRRSSWCRHCLRYRRPSVPVDPMSVHHRVLSAVRPSMRPRCSPSGGRERPAALLRLRGSAAPAEEPHPCRSALVRLRASPPSCCPPRNLGVDRQRRNHAVATLWVASRERVASPLM